MRRSKSCGRGADYVRCLLVVVVGVLFCGVTWGGPTTYYVDEDAAGGGSGLSWASAFSTLQDALAVAVGGDTILVAQGTYQPDEGGAELLGDATATFTIDKQIDIVGGYAGAGEPNPDANDPTLFETILSGALSPVYVSTTGSDHAACGLTPGDPCQTISFGIQRAQAIGGSLVLVQTGIYNEVIVMADGIDVQGGYDLAWEFDDHDEVGHGTTVVGQLYAPDGQYMTVRAWNMTEGAVLSNFRLNGPDATPTPLPAAHARSSYVIHAFACTGVLSLEHLDITCGDGALGGSGQPGVAAPQNSAAPGFPGQNSQSVGFGCNSSGHGNGGHGAGSGSLAGGDGGDGGRADTSCGGLFPDFDATNGLPGMNAAIYQPGSYGYRGSGGGECNPGHDGNNGRPTIHGVGGSGGTYASSIVGEFWWTGGNATHGTLGQNGTGGGGGGGGGGCDSGTDCYGPGGGGGGAGGVRAPEPGRAARSGGSSFGVFALDAEVDLIDVHIAMGNGGNGGVGGSGKKGQPGGHGGNGGNPANNCAWGGDGGDGSAGGDSGAGGGGAAGWAYGVFGQTSNIWDFGVTIVGGAPGFAGPGGLGTIPSGDGGDGQAGSVVPLVGGWAGSGASTPLASFSRAHHVVSTFGIFVDGTISGVTIDGGHASAVSDNRNGGGVLATSGFLTLSDCIIRNCVAADSGGGVYANNAQVTLERCRIHDNLATEGGGCGNDIAAHMSLNRCEVYDNEAVIGGGIFDGSSATLTCRSTIVRDNSATSNAGGGGIHIDQSSAQTRVVGCTVTRNSAPAAGGGIRMTIGDLTVSNSVVWGNMATQFPEIVHHAGTISVTYSDVEGGYAGTGNIDVDPLFVDAANDDFHLQALSPCRNAGDSSDPLLSPEDFDGDARVECTIVDIGADEIVGCPFVAPITNLTCSHNPNGYNPLLWNNGELYDVIQVYRDGVLIDEVLPPSHGYNDFVPPSGSRFYEIVGVVGPASSTPVSCTVEVPPMAVETMVCSPVAPCSCDINVTWSNPESYDQIEIHVDGMLHSTVGGSVEATTITLPQTGMQEICVVPLIDGIPTDMPTCCLFDCGPVPVLSVSNLVCSVDHSQCDVGVTWVLESTYSQIEVLLDGAVVDTLGGASTGKVVVLPGPGSYEICLRATTICGTTTTDVCCTVVCSQPFVRGDCNVDGANNIADAVKVLNFLFPNPPPSDPLLCTDACDCNDDEAVNIADAVCILNSLFGAITVPPPPPFPACDVDPDGTMAGCDSFPPCTP